MNVSIIHKAHNKISTRKQARSQHDKAYNYVDCFYNIPFHLYQQIPYQNFNYTLKEKINKIKEPFSHIKHAQT